MSREAHVRFCEGPQVKLLRSTHPFREDDCRVRKDHAPHNFAALRKFALALLRQDTQYPKRSLRSRRKTAERLPDYRAALLGLVPRGSMRVP